MSARSHLSGRFTYHLQPSKHGPSYLVDRGVLGPRWLDIHDMHHDRGKARRGKATTGNRAQKPRKNSSTTQPLHPLTPTLISEKLAKKSNIGEEILLVKILFILDMRLAGTLDGRSGSDASSWDPAAVSCNSQYSYNQNISFKSNTC